MCRCAWKDSARSSTPSTRSSVEDSGLVLDPTEGEFEHGWGVSAFIFGQVFGSGNAAGSELGWVDCVGLGDGTSVRLPFGNKNIEAPS